MHFRSVTKQKLSKSFIVQHSWVFGHYFKFQNSKVIFYTDCIFELDVLDNFLHSNHILVFNEKCDFTKLLTAQKILFSFSNYLLIQIPSFFSS